MATPPNARQATEAAAVASDVTPVPQPYNSLCTVQVYKKMIPFGFRIGQVKSRSSRTMCGDVAKHPLDHSIYSLVSQHGSRDQHLLIPVWEYQKWGHSCVGTSASATRQMSSNPPIFNVMPTLPTDYRYRGQHNCIHQSYNYCMVLVYRTVKFAGVIDGSAALP